MSVEFNPLLGIHEHDELASRRKIARMLTLGKLFAQRASEIVATNAISDSDIWKRTYQQTQFPTRGVS